MLKKSFGFAFAKKDADFCYYYLEGVYPMTLNVHVLTFNDSIADDTWEFLNVVESLLLWRNLSLHCRCWKIDYGCHGIVVSCQTSNSSPFGGFDHSHSRSFCHQKDQLIIEDNTKQLPSSRDGW
jgi:hypothetical protein